MLMHIDLPTTRTNATERVGGGAWCNIFFLFSPPPPHFLYVTIYLDANADWFSQLLGLMLKQLVEGFGVIFSFLPIFPHNILAASADQLSQLLGLMLLKELVDGSGGGGGGGGGGASPKMLVAVAARGEAGKVRELVTKNPRWVRIHIISYHSINYQTLFQYYHISEANFLKIKDALDKR